MSNNNNTGKVKINSNTYQTVAYRIAEFRKKYPIESGWAIQTECRELSEEKVIFKAVILNPEGKVVACGHAEEIRNKTFINKTSALENAETSAIGRALAAAGFIGNQFASADEVINAKLQQNEQAKDKPKPTPITFQEPVSLRLPNISEPGWEKNRIPDYILPKAERGRSIFWGSLIYDTVQLQGKKRMLSGREYLHMLEKWDNPLVQQPALQVIIKAAREMREKIKQQCNNDERITVTC